MIYDISVVCLYVKDIRDVIYAACVKKNIVSFLNKKKITSRANYRRYPSLFLRTSRIPIIFHCYTYKLQLIYFPARELHITLCITRKKFKPILFVPRLLVPHVSKHHMRTTLSLNEITSLDFACHEALCAQDISRRSC